MKPPFNARWLGNAIGLLVAIYLAVSLGQTIKKNYDLAHQINQLQQQISQLKSQRQQLEFELSYYQTSSYQEREAKSKLGLVLPGEKEIILPSPAPSIEPDSTIKSKKTSSNFSQWLDFLDGRN